MKSYIPPESHEPVIIPITDELDLHLFQPREIPDLLDSYLEACVEKGIKEVRIVHGKGTGVLKERVWSLLRRDPRVLEVKGAPAECGGWGACCVRLRSDPSASSINPPSL